MGRGRRIALVTGAARGLGREFAVALAGCGHVVAGVDVDDQSGTAERIAADGGQFFAFTADVTDPDTAASVVADVAACLGGLQILVNIAGLQVEAPLVLCGAAVPYLRTAGWGRIVNVVPAPVQAGPADPGAHAATRSALVGFTRALAAELGAQGITVNAIVPGLLDPATVATSTGAEGGGERVPARQPIPRTAGPGELVATLRYICGEGSGLLTGRAITVDYGSSVR